MNNFLDDYFCSNSLVVQFGIITFIQGLFLLSLAWFRPNVAYYRDVIFGTLLAVSSLLILCFHFRMMITTQLNLVLLLCITFFSIFETMRLRR